jgi:hypothetical protein
MRHAITLRDARKGALLRVTRWWPQKDGKDVDGRDKPGHDGVGRVVWGLSLA